MLALFTSALSGYLLLPWIDQDDDEVPSWLWAVVLVPAILGMTLVFLARAGVFRKGGLPAEIVASVERITVTLVERVYGAITSVASTVTGVFT